LVEKFGGSFKSLRRNWQSKTKDHPPIRIGRHLQIVGTCQSSTGDGKQLIIPAAGAFGTGEHATTAMSLRLLAERARKLPRGWRLLDIGTGTGILALAARRLGAEEALGMDIDPGAVAHARRNANLNCLARVRFIGADVLRWKTVSRYDIITANLYSELLITALPHFRLWLRSGGWLIASGILHNQSQLVVSVLEDQCFRLEQLRQRGKWVALLCQLAR
jgi:ribosomal protein L11 methyltransferase